MIENLDYSGLYNKLTKDQATSYKLRARMAEDDLRDPVDALKDAEMLVLLARKRLDMLASAS